MAITQHDAAILIRHVNGSLIVRQLQGVLKAEGQPTSGLKQPLQKRLTTYIESIVAKGDTIAFQRVKDLVHCHEISGDHSPARSLSSGLPHAVHGFSAPPSSRPAVTPHTFGHPGALARIFWKESPFYTVLSPLSDLAKCPVMSSHRNTVTTVVSLSQHQVERLRNNPSYRCMVYCATLEQLTGFVRNTEITFPHQVELRVNEVVAAGPGLNLRGIKNKPGSTRPADITDRLNLVPNYRNQIGLTYAMTQKNTQDFAFVVNLVKFETVENLVMQLKEGNVIAKETVIDDMIKKNEDAELIATSTIMSLKCPISTLRIDLPVRSSYCAHAQCFDATSFLQLQLQAPTWTCPTCNRSIMFSQLVVDKYFDDILNSTPRTVESVTIDSEGKWSVAAEGSNSPVASSSDEDVGRYDNRVVDLDEIQSSRKYQPSASATPAGYNSREESLANGANGRNGSTGVKRSITQVIDLTLSDDDEPTPPAKRANTNSSSGSNRPMLTPSSILGHIRSRSDSAAPNGYSLVGTPPYYATFTDLPGDWYSESF